MPVFSNRSLHRCLQSIEPILGIRRAADLRSRLQQGSAAAVAAEWEIVALAGLQRVGRILAPTGDDESQLDVLFLPSDVNRPVLVEITAVSDDGLHDKNPVDRFMDAVSRRFAKRGALNTGGLHFAIGNNDGPDGVVLGVPDKFDIDNFVCSDELEAFISSVARLPGTPCRFAFECRGINSAIEYTPGKKTITAGYRSFRGLPHRKRNHVYTRLRQKSKQAKRAGSDQPVVIVLCDAGCHALSTTMTDLWSPQAEEVIDLFLNGRAHVQKGEWMIQQGERPGSSRIAAVILVSAHETSLIHAQRNTRHLRARPIMSLDASRDADLAHAIRTVASIIDSAPPVARMPVNARHQSRRGWHYGGFHISSGGSSNLKAKMSLLAVQDLLAGKLTFDELRDDHPELFRAIAKATLDGRMISNVRIERCPDLDDDWLEFEFGATAPTRLFDARRSSSNEK